MFDFCFLLFFPRLFFRFFLPFFLYFPWFFSYFSCFFHFFHLFFHIFVFFSSARFFVWPIRFSASSSLLSFLPCPFPLIRFSSLAVPPTPHTRIFLVALFLLTHSSTQRFIFFLSSLPDSSFSWIHVFSHFLVLFLFLSLNVPRGTSDFFFCFPLHFVSFLSCFFYIKWP